MAHTKALGSTKLGRDSASKRLGVKVNDREPVRVGEVIVRQRGTRYIPGTNVKRAGDDTLYAMKTGVVHFRNSKKTKFDGNRRFVKVVSVIVSVPQ